MSGPSQALTGACTLKNDALDYAFQQIPIFPVEPEGKAPLIEGGFYAATTDPEQIERWRTRWPDAHIATPTGVRTGLVVFDADTE